MPENINELFLISDIKEYLGEVADDATNINHLIVGYTSKDHRLIWKGLGARTELLGLLDGIHYELLHEVDHDGSL